MCCTAHAPALEDHIGQRHYHHRHVARAEELMTLGAQHQRNPGEGLYSTYPCSGLALEAETSTRVTNARRAERASEELEKSQDLEGAEPTACVSAGFKTQRCTSVLES